MKSVKAVAALCALFFSAGALAAINVGVTLSTTGPARRSAFPRKTRSKCCRDDRRPEDQLDHPRTMRPNTTAAVTNTRKLISGEQGRRDPRLDDHADSLAMVDVCAEAETPMISLAASARIIDPANPKSKWIFKTPQNDSLMADAIIAHMKAHGVKTLGYVGLQRCVRRRLAGEMKRAVGPAGIKPGRRREVQPQRRERHRAGAEAGRIECRRGAGRRIGNAGRDAAQGAEGARLQGQDLPDARGRQRRLHPRRRQRRQRLVPAVGPDAVYEQLPDSNPIKKVSGRLRRKYEAKFGQRSTFGGHAWDAAMLLQRAVPEALKKGQPGTKEFRAALRDALEGVKDAVGVHGVFNMTATDHLGFDNRAG
jgi:branched-chain amino acid transport system substrate-binding protein